MRKSENQTWIIVTALSVVFVLGAVFGATHLQYAFAGMFGPNSPCGNGGELTHWDKFVFTTSVNIVGPQGNHPPGTELDVKVEDFEGELADIKAKIAAKLTALSYTRADPGMSEIKHNNINAILDVEYAIECKELPA